MPIQIEQVPPDYVPIPTRHALEVAAWRTPGGVRYVQLKNDSDAVWEAYAKDVAGMAREIIGSGAMQIDLSL